MPRQDQVSEPQSDKPQGTVRMEAAVELAREALRSSVVANEVEVIDPYVMDLVRKHGSTMTNSEIVRKFLPKQKLAVSARGELNGLLVPEDVKKRIGRAIADEMRRNRHSDDDLIDSFGRVAAFGFALARSPSKEKEIVDWLREMLKANKPERVVYYLMREPALLNPPEYVDGERKS